MFGVGGGEASLCGARVVSSVYIYLFVYLLIYYLYIYACVYSFMYMSVCM